MSRPAAAHHPSPDKTVRERLLGAAADLFARKGYAATFVGEIVAAAGVTKPALYYYFKSKEALYLEMMQSGAADFIGILERHAKTRGPVAARIRGICEEVFDLLLSQLPVVRVMYAVYYGPPQGAPHIDFDSFHNRFHGTIERLVHLGIARNELRRADPQAAVLAVTGALSACIESNICHPERAIGREALGRVLDAVFNGIAARPKENSR